MADIQLGDLKIELVRKDIKNLHLTVLPPDGHVRIAAPAHMRMESIRAFAISRLAWIRNQQGRIQAQDRERPRDYSQKESHFLWGRRYLLERIDIDAAPSVDIKRNRLVLRVRPGSDHAKCHAIVDAWYRAQLRAALPALIAKWAPVIKVEVGRVIVRRMKTMWGGCNPASGIIRLNTDLAKKPIECLEYIVVHEMTHLLEPTHNARFQALMDLFLPHWRELRARLNQLPVRHEDWKY